MPMKIGILMGGDSKERNVSLKTGAAVLKACKDLGYEVAELKFFHNYKKFKNIMISCDMIFNALHGGIGENGEIQKWMYDNNIKFTGSNAESSSICMDKSKSKTIVGENNFKTPTWNTLINEDEKFNIELPVVVKPNNEGSTFGLSIVKKISDLNNAIKFAFKDNNSIIIEKYIKGRELTVTILNNKAYPIIEIIPSHNIYDYECKYTEGLTKYICPAKIDIGLENNIKKDTEKIFSLLGCKAYGRADFILDEKGDYYFLEMNTLPGMTGTSLVPKAVKASGMTFKILIKNIIKLSF